MVYVHVGHCDVGVVEDGDVGDGDGGVDFDDANE